MKNKGAIFFSGVILILTILLAIPTYRYTKKNSEQMSRRYNSRLSPVIMIPGSSATENRFDGMVAQLNSDQPKKHGLLKIKVMNNGKMKFKGKISARDAEPIIVVGFENNHDGYSNIKKQARMFNECFAQLYERYEFNNCKCIGHSNGGLVWTCFLENYSKNYDVSFKKLMTIGSPYNFSEQSMKKKSQMLSDFIKYSYRLPDDLIVYSVAGTETYASDGLVPEKSVEAGKYIFQGKVKSFTQITVTGNEAGHSDLPENRQIVDLIQKYMLDGIRRQPDASR